MLKKIRSEAQLNLDPFNPAQNSSNSDLLECSFKMFPPNQSKNPLLGEVFFRAPHAHSFTGQLGLICYSIGTQKKQLYLTHKKFDPFFFSKQTARATQLINLNFSFRKFQEVKKNEIGFSMTENTSMSGVPHIPQSDLCKINFRESI